MINNLTLSDKRLSPESIGLLVYFLSLPPGWDFKISNYCKDRPVCEKKVRRMMRELSKFGYLSTYRERSGGGSSVWVIEISEVTTVFKIIREDEETNSAESSTSPNCQVDTKLPPRSTTLELPSNSGTLNNNKNNTNNKDDIFINKNISCLVNETDQISSTKQKPKKMTESQKKKITKNKELKIGAIEVLQFLNEKTGKNFRKVDTNLNLIIAILKTDATISNCRQVIAKKYREWTGSEMEKYLRPKSLFNKTNFEQYFGELVLPKD